MIALDTNILVYGHRADSPWHESAKAVIASLAEERGRWALPWPCIHEFYSIVTHPRIYDPPTPWRDAVTQVETWLSSPSLTLLAEGPGYWAALAAELGPGKITGPRVHDARIAALCRFHRVRELWSADRDFNRFADLKVRNPLVGRA